jgi:hypothetical protein
MANPFDKILEEKELGYEDLTPAEKRLYEQAGNSTKAISPEDLLDFVSDALYSATLELCDTPSTPEFADKNAHLKARVKVYVTLLAFLESPIKAEKAIERSIR